MYVLDFALLHIVQFLSHKQISARISFKLYC